MNKIVPFKKEIKFNENIGEITSIALDDTLKFKDSNTIVGDLIVRGCHKYNDIEDSFSYPLPTTITVDDKYDTKETKIMIDDFYYEIVNDDTLIVKIDLVLDNLKFKENEIVPIEEEIKFNRDDEKIQEEIINEEIIQDNSNEKEYSVYRVYVVMEGDNLSKILEKYNITSEELSHYNDINNIKPGVKLIIPSLDE